MRMEITHGADRRVISPFAKDVLQESGKVVVPTKVLMFCCNVERGEDMMSSLLEMHRKAANGILLKVDVCSGMGQLRGNVGYDFVVFHLDDASDVNAAQEFATSLSPIYFAGYSCILAFTSESIMGPLSPPMKNVYEFSKKYSLPAFFYSVLSKESCKGGVEKVYRAIIASLKK